MNQPVSKFYYDELIKAPNWSTAVDNFCMNTQLPSCYFKQYSFEGESRQLDKILTLRDDFPIRHILNQKSS